MSGTLPHRVNQNLNSRIDYMVSHLKSIRTESSVVQNHKRKPRSDRNGNSNKELSLGPVNIYSQRQDGRLGKNFEILRPMLSSTESGGHNTPRMTLSSSQPAKDTLLRENMVRYAHI
jgi:hypothetical protein